jgi:hypothetical protein
MYTSAEADAVCPELLTVSNLLKTEFSLKLMGSSFHAEGIIFFSGSASESSPF